MSIIRIPADIVVPSRTSRRNLIGTGLGIAATGILANASAHQDAHESTPDSGGTYIGSDGDPVGTGDSTPGPGGTVADFARYSPYLEAVEPGDKHFEITFSDRTIWISNDVQYAAWTLNGTVPGPALRAVQGDTVHITIKNDAPMTHSVDFHAARVAPDRGYALVQPGETFEWEFTVDYPGAFMVHCGTAPVLMHIAAGMYLPLIVDPKEGGFQPATEIVLSQSEFYTMEGEDGVHISDAERLFSPAGAPNILAFNGHQSQYVDEPIQIPVGELVRIYMVNHGPNVWSAFHVVGAIFSHVYLNANPNNAFEGLQTISVGPGDGVCCEFTVDEPGNYVAVNHSFGHAAHGAIAVLAAS